MRSYIECAEEFMNFYDYNGMNGSSEQGYNRAHNARASQDNRGEQNRPKESFEDKFATYSQKSEEELMSQLADVAKRMKAQGTFDPQSLENLYNTAYPMLNDEQRRRMRGIIDMLEA